MSSLKVEEANNFTDIIEKILRHPNLKIVSVGIRAVGKLAKSASSSSVISDLKLVLLLIECLQSSEINIGPPTIDILIDLLPSNNLLDYQEVKNQLENSLNSTDDVIRCRTYNVAVEIAKKDAFTMEKLHFILKRCISELDKNDILLQLSILELLKELCLVSHGLVYLENKGIFDKLLKRIETINEDPLAGVLIPGLMKFFGNIAAVHPEKVINQYPAVINYLFDCLMSNDSQLLYTGLDTLGFLSRSAEGKKILDAIPGGQLINVLVRIITSISNYPSDLKSRALNCLENVFWVDASSAINNQIAYISRKWFDRVFPSDLSMLLNLCHSPFEDISLAAFGLLRSLSYYTFGQDAVSRTGGMVEFLMDRSVRSTHEVKQIKYEIIQILSASNSFDAATTVQLNKYIREGANYIQAQMEVVAENP